MTTTPDCVAFTQFTISSTQPFGANVKLLCPTYPEGNVPQFQLVAPNVPLVMLTSTDFRATFFRSGGADYRFNFNTVATTCGCHFAIKLNPFFALFAVFEVNNVTDNNYTRLLWSYTIHHVDHTTVWRKSVCTLSNITGGYRSGTIPCC